MTPIPGEPHDRPAHEMTTRDGRKVKVKIPGLAPPPEPGAAEQRGAAEPPRDDPRPPLNPNHVGA